MRKIIGWAASWTFYYLSGCVDMARARLGARWLRPIYFRLLDASDDAQTWGGGRGTWEYGLPVENEYWRDFCIGNNRYSRALAHQKKLVQRRARMLDAYNK